MRKETREPDPRPMTEAPRTSFDLWMEQEPDLERLLAVLEWRMWSPDLNLALPSYHRLDAADADRLKGELTRRVEQAGGRVALGHVVCRVAGGVLKIELPS